MHSKTKSLNKSQENTILKQSELFFLSMYGKQIFRFI